MIEKGLNYLKKTNKKFLIFWSILVAFLIIKWMMPEIHYSILNAYLIVITKSSSFILSIIGIENDILKTSLILHDGTVLQINSKIGLKYIIVIMLVTLALENNTRDRSLPFILIIWVFVANLLSLILDVIVKLRLPSSTNFDRIEFYLMLLCVFPLIFYGKRIFSQYLSGTDTIKLLTSRLSIALFIYYFLSFVYKLIFSDSHLIADLLSYGILSISKQMLLFLDFNVTIEGRLLFDKTTHINMGTQCIGINIMLVFILIILIGDRISIKNMIFIPAGVLIIMLLNAIRAVLLFVYITETTLDDRALKLQHDVYNLIIYASIISMWYLWFTNFKEGVPKDKLEELSST